MSEKKPAKTANNLSNKKIINREISWLSFNERVLQEAEDPRVPLVQRMRFLGIFSNNLDEFFRVRVATVQRVINFGKSAREVIGGKPKKILNQIQKTSVDQHKRFDNAFRNILKELEKEKIFVLREDKLNKSQGLFVTDYFRKNVRPALVPIMVNGPEDFPYLREKSIYLAIKFIRKKAHTEPKYALIEIPSDVVGRFVVLPQRGERKYIMILDDMIRYCAREIFSIFSFDDVKAYTIKITRDAELDIDNDVSRSLLEKISRSIKQRKRAEPVRMVYDATMPRDLLLLVKSALDLEENDSLIAGARYHNFKDFIGFPNIGGPHLLYKPAPPLALKEFHPHESILKVIKQQDIMLHFPYQSFNYVIDLLREAAIDPNVKSIKITLYRLAKKSKIINALINAARNRKEVTAVMELQARFDEEANIGWTDKLQEAGVKIIFGVPGLKVHSKLCLIEREENGKIVHYANVSTGNYNESTSTIYSDTSLLTADPRITSDVNRMFTFFKNNYRTYTYKHLITSPLHMRRRMTKLIDSEIKNAKAGKKAYIILKLNSLVDPEMIEKLYNASNAGVRINLIIRGICSLVPDIEGQSENIEAVSIVDKYLEHSRILIFGNGGDELYYISSADWMTRNLDHRVEAACPIYDKDIQQQLRTMIDIQLSGNTKARILDAKQSNKYKVPIDNKRVRSQDDFYFYLEKLGKQKGSVDGN